MSLLLLMGTANQQDNELVIVFKVKGGENTQVPSRKPCTWLSRRCSVRLTPFSVTFEYP